MNVFDLLQIAAGLCAIPIYFMLRVTPVRAYRERAQRRNYLTDRAVDALVLFVFVMVLDFLGSLPAMGIGTKTELGQNLIEPASHLLIVGSLVGGLWSARQINTATVVFMATLGLIGFVCSSFIAEGDSTRHVANGLMPAFNWLVTALCLVSLVRLGFPHSQDQFDVLLFIGLLVLAAAVAQNEQIIQWASGNAHYPQLK